MDEVSRAVAFIQRSTARTPASTGRLERKLRDRDVPAAAIPLALQDAAEQGLVDDRAYAAALVAEGREKGHAPRRLRADLRTRELPEDVIETALGEVRDRDPEAVAFDVAQRKARSYRDLDAEKAFRRLVAYLARRGHNEHVARKVARQVVFDDREDDRVAGH
nr:regulatory protein RecX [Salsipaludibacter albus]